MTSTKPKSVLVQAAQSASSLLSENAVVYWLQVVVLTIATMVLYRFVKIRVLRRRFGAKPPMWLPSPGIINSRKMARIFKMKLEGHLLEFIFSLWNGPGTNETMRILIARKELLVTADPENIKALLATQFNDFKLGFRHGHFAPLLGEGIFTLDDEGWKGSRALLRPNFSREKISHLVSLESHLQHLFKHINKFNGQPFDLQLYFFKFTVDTATEFLFGHSANTLSDASIGEYPEELFEGQFEFFDCFNKAQAICSTRAWFQQFYYLADLVYYFEFRRCNKVVHNFANYYVNLALKMSPDELEKASSDGYIFLYELAKQTRNPKVLRDQALNIMIAGRDTTAGLLSFTFYELAKNPDIWARLKEEVYLTFGDGENPGLDKITFESLKKCSMLKNIISETLRMYPSVPINYRQAKKHTTLPRGGGVDGNSPLFVEQGSVVAYIIIATHRNEAYYGKDAHVFRPDRWSDRNLKPGWAYLPFNGGPRICLGQQFAITEASYVIARICQQFPNLFDHDKEPEKYPPRMVSQLTNSLAAGCWVSLTP